MSYNYDALEEALEYASKRLPVNVLGKIMTQVEDVICTAANGNELEKRIYSMTNDYMNSPTRPIFSLKLLRDNENTHKNNEVAA